MADSEQYKDDKRYKLGKRYFIHAYAIKGAKEKDGKTLRSKRHRRIGDAYSGAKAWENNVYYWWFECLKRNKDYERCCKQGGTQKLADIYRDFGNIYEYEFWDWWSEKVNSEETRGEFLFAEALAERLEVLTDTKVKEDEDYLVVKVPLSVRSNHLVKSFRGLLNDYDAQIQKVRKKSTARYKVSAKVPNNTYYTSLKVWDEKQKNENAKHVEIAEACGLYIDTNYTYVDGRGGLTQQVNLKKIDSFDDKMQKRLKRVYAQRCSKQVKQRLDQAERYIANAVTNYFPTTQK
tara:strand:- start:6265 stop:7137 length:873 start_codon:yes stop_codon:yes gene_type:complete